MADGAMDDTDRSPSSIPILHPPTRRFHPPTRSTAVLAVILILGAFAVVLAGVSSTVFDLDRHAVPKELALHITALLVLPWLMRDRPLRIELGVVGVLLVAFVAWSTLSALFSSNWWLAGRALGITISGVILFGAGRLAASEGRAGLVAGGLGLAAVVAAVLGAAQAWGLEWSWLASGRPPGATFGNRNFLAHLLAVSAPVLVVSCMDARRPTAWVGGLVGLTLLTLTVVLTRSRAAWLGLGAGLVVVGLALLVLFAAGPAAEAGPVRGVVTRAPFHRARRMKWIAAAIALGALLAVVLPNRLEWRSASPYSDTLAGLANYREGSGRGRLIQYGHTLELVKDAPLLGTGPGNWFVHYPRVTEPGDPAFSGSDPIPTNPWPSSDWVAFLAERGAMGVLLLLGAFGAAALTAARRLARRAKAHAAARHAATEDETRSALTAATLLGTLAVAVVAGMFDAVLLLAAPTFFVFTLLGLTLPPVRAVVSRTVSGLTARVLRAAVFGVSVLLVLTSAGRLAAIRTAGDGRDRAAVERALRYDPGNHRLHLVLARRGACRARVPHAEAAARLMPYHDAPRAALRACGVRSG